MWITIATFATALATFALAFLAWRQLCALNKYVEQTGAIAEATREGSETAKRALDNLERPWIFVLPANLMGLDQDPFAGEHDVRLVYHIQNTGRTPAWILGTSCEMREVAKPFPEELPHAQTAENYLPLAPNQRIENFLNATLDFDQLRKGQKDLLFFGCVDYKDVFGEAHRTAFGFELNVAYSLHVLGRGESSWTQVARYCKNT